MGQDIEGEDHCNDPRNDHCNDNDRLGFSVALSGDSNVVVLGSPRGGFYGQTGGLARVYEWDPDTTPDPWWSMEQNGFVGGDTPGKWVKRGEALKRGFVPHHKCGWAVATNHDGDFVGVSCRGGRWQPSTVTVYEWNGTAHVQRGSDMRVDDDDDAVLGACLAMSDDGNTVVSGAPVSRYNAHGHRDGGWDFYAKFGGGDVYTWQWRDNDWEKRYRTSVSAQGLRERGARRLTAKRKLVAMAAYDLAVPICTHAPGLSPPIQALGRVGSLPGT